MTSEPDFTKCTIAIWGLGLMGGSMAYALAGKCASLIGIDPEPNTVAQASQSGIFSHVSCEPDNLINQADIIILAAPVRAILDQISALPGLHNGQCVVIDIGSTKRQIVNALQTLPSRFDPLGGHPMCGNEFSSFENADAQLFSGANFALVELPRTSVNAKTLGETLVRVLQAVPLWLNAETHDHWTAMTSHMPYLISNALAAVVPPEAKPMAGSGFQSTSRLAAASPEMMLDIIETNQDYLLEALHIFQENLTVMENLIRRSDHDSLKTKLEIGRDVRNAFFTKG